MRSEVASAGIYFDTFDTRTCTRKYLLNSQFYLIFQDAFELIKENRALRSMLAKIRRNPATFERYWLLLLVCAPFIQNLSYEFSLWTCDSRLHYMCPRDFDTSSYLNMNLVSISQRKHFLSIVLSSYHLQYSVSYNTRTY